MAKVKCFLVLRKARYQQVKIVRMTQEKPRMDAGEIAVQVVLNVDARAFDEFIPEVVAEVGAGEMITPEIDIEEAR